MNNLISANFYTGDTPSVTLTGTGTDRLIVVVAMSTAGSSQAFTAATLNAVSGTVHESVTFDGGAAVCAGVAYWTDSQHMGAGTFTLEGTWASATNDRCYLVLEYDNFDQTTPLDALVISTSADQLEPYDNTVNVTGKTGKQALLLGIAADGATTTAAGFITSNDALTEVSEDYFSNVRLASYDIPNILDANETYSLKYSWLNTTAVTMDSIVTAVIGFNEPTAATLTADTITSGTIRAGDTVTINLSNATNAAGKTLSIPQGALTATAQDINSISFTAPDLKTFGDKTGDYSTDITITVDDAGDSDTITFQIAPDVGDESAAIAALEGIYTDPAFSAVELTDKYYTETISGADFTVGAVPVLGTEQVFNLWIYETTSVTPAWGTPFEVTIAASGAVSVSSGLLRDVLKPVLSNVLKNIFEE